MKNLLLFLIVFASCPVFSKTHLNESRFVTGVGQIYYVKDGDTYKVKTDRNNLYKLLKNKLTTKKHIDFSKNTFVIRLANINTEESVHRIASKNTAFGKETSNVVKKMLKNKKVKYQCFSQGRYERAVCSIQTNDYDMGIWLVENGYSDYITKYFKHPFSHKKYVNAQNNQKKHVRNSENKLTQSLEAVSASLIIDKVKNKSKLYRLVEKGKEVNEKYKIKEKFTSLKNKWNKK